MDEEAAQDHVREADAQAAAFGRGLLVSTFAVRHHRGLDIVFVLNGPSGDFQIGMGAASEDYRTVLTIGVDRERGRSHAVSSWTVEGRVIRVPVRILHQSASAIVVEASPLPLDKRPPALKCWSFLRQQDTDHYSDVIGLVSPGLAALTPVKLSTYTQRPKR